MTESVSQKGFYQMVFALVLPMALQNLISVAISSADVMMLGRVGETVLSASSLAGQVQFIMTLFFFGITSGAAVLTAQYWGKRDIRTIEKVMGIALRIALSVAVLFMGIVLVFTEPIMRIFTKEIEVIAEGVKYLKIIAFSYVIFAFTMVYLNIMRSIEKVIISTVVYLSSFGINVVLNAIFIFGLCGFPAMGIQGAALATLFARIVEFLIVVIYDKRINKVIHFKVKDLFQRDPVIFKDFMHYSTPVMLNELFWGAGTSMSAVVIGHLGSSIVAANSAAQVARQLATVIAFGIANATAIIIGKKIGEGDYKEAELSASKLVKLSIYAGVGGGIVILLVRPILMSVLTLSAAARGHLSMMMLVMAYFVIAQAFNTTLVVGVFRAGGDTKIGLIMDVTTMWGGSILMGAAAAFIFKWPITVVYMLLMSDEIIKIPISIWRYKSKKWLKNITR